MSGRSSFGDFLTGVLVGSAIGYVVAMLNAPRPGDETRQMWTERGRELRDRAMDTVQSTVDKTGKMVADSRERLGSTMESTRNRMQERVSDLKDRGESVVTDVREQMSDNLRRAAESVEPKNPPESMGPQGPEM
jgi:gas vesicle protein